jgi:hypothetical protein
LSTDFLSYAYSDAIQFASKFYNKDIKPALDIIEWRTMYNLWVFDMSKQADSYIPSGNNIVLNFTFAGAGLTAAAQCYAMTFYDRVAEFQAGTVNGQFTVI